MQDHDRPRFGAALAVLGVLPGGTLDKGKIETYFRVLARATILDVEAAITRALEECEFFPAPAKLLSYVREIQEDRRARAAGEAPPALPAEAAVPKEEIQAFIRELTKKKSLDPRADRR